MPRFQLVSSLFRLWFFDQKCSASVTFGYLSRHCTRFASMLIHYRIFVHCIFNILAVFKGACFAHRWSFHYSSVLSAGSKKLEGACCAKVASKPCLIQAQQYWRKIITLM